MFDKYIIYGIGATIVVGVIWYFIATIKSDAVNEYKVDTAERVIEKANESTKKQEQLTVELDRQKVKQATKVDSAIQEARKTIKPTEVTNEATTSDQPNPDADWVRKFNDAVREANHYTDNPQ